MTTAIGVTSGRVGRPKAEPVGMVFSLSAALREMLVSATAITFPSDRYRADPVAFCREILGVEPWSAQIEIMEAIRDHRRVAVKSGHKVGKSHTIACVALWFYCSYEDSQAVMTSTTSRQVDDILWRQLQMVRARSGRCVACKEEIKRLVALHDARQPGGMSQQAAEEKITRPCPHSAIIRADRTEGDHARTGLKSLDFRSITGFTAKEAEAVAGISGKNLLYLPDEASGIPDVIFHGIEGNRAGGAKIAMFGNPTKNEGEFFEAWHSKSELYRTITVSSESTPNAISGECLIPGLAEREWIEEKKEEWGVNSPIYKVRVKGEHAEREEGKIFSLHMIGEAESRWYDTEADGRLFIGLDPAGSSGSGDESAFAPRRGKKVVELYTRRGLDDRAHLDALLAMIARLAKPREVAVVVIDREGKIGFDFYNFLRAWLEQNPGAFELVVVRASDKAHRKKAVYGTMRDELAGNLEEWFRDGGAIPEDTKLVKELHAMTWIPGTLGRVKLIGKKEIRKAIGRSPDRFDAIALSCWEPASIRDDLPDSAKQQAAQQAQTDSGRPALDPYNASAAWR